MNEWKNYPKERLCLLKDECRRKYDEFKALGIKLDMSRGKPSPDVLDLSNALLEAPASYICEDGTDARNYGTPTGIPECRRLFGELLGIAPEQIIVGNNASLQLMHDILGRLYFFGTLGERPWKDLERVRFLCPSPGYDRHFAVSEDFGAEMITVPMTENGPDMDIVERLVSEDESVKGIWCVPLYSNPQGIVYSDETVERLAAMKTKAKDFRIFWDNAYGVHHIYEEHSIANILDAARRNGNEDRIYYFFSTSKITFPGGGIGMVASSPTNITEQQARINIQTIGYDKLAQLRAVQFLKSPSNIRAHMRKIGDMLRPKFDIVTDTLERELGGTGLVSWMRPKGGYFVAVDTLEGCAKAVVAMAKEAGTVLTGAGATFPYGKDPRDTNIRIAPTFPSTEDLQKAMDLFCLCVKMVSIDKFLSEQEDAE
ncbi:MAG: aminotransferase class I/II-fold pyridoxal phosphate-dependent enzyme [Clostridiales Family XIII bacterium]|jgi:DNA-binding transcriptional MocR family regulator|nr:aminotransferase class I/II-fold pyridoxal phosphate-dependent enzyme [Clostridiales Family XIII bacterium]